MLWFELQPLASAPRLNPCGHAAHCLKRDYGLREIGDSNTESGFLENELTSLERVDISGHRALCPAHFNQKVYKRREERSVSEDEYWRGAHAVQRKLNATTEGFLVHVYVQEEEMLVGKEVTMRIDKKQRVATCNLPPSSPARRKAAAATAAAINTCIDGLFVLVTILRVLCALTHLVLTNP